MHLNQAMIYDKLTHMKSVKIKRIVVALWLGNASGREILSGILRYAKMRKLWQTTILQLPNGFSPSMIEQLQQEQIDGIVTSDPTNETVQKLVRGMAMPFVVIAPRTKIDRPNGGAISFVNRDDFRIGMIAAQYFMSIGRFNSYGFIQGIGGVDRAISDREKGFRQKLAESGYSCSTLSSFTAPDDINDVDRLSLWIKSLPKPAAVMCFYDPPAVLLLKVCHKLGISVPAQVSVLGVDNDALICETAIPQLSSLQPDHEGMGYIAAQELDALIAHRTSRRRKPVLKHRIVERDTTKKTSPSAALVHRALDFIAGHVSTGIGVSDVVSYLGVSRRLADLRFREIENRSILETIENRRLKIAVEKLKTTTWPITRIVTASGYSSLQAMEAAFRKRFNRSPRTFRA